VLETLYKELAKWGWDSQKIVSIVVSFCALLLSAFSLWRQRERFKAEVIVLLPRAGEDNHTLVVINVGNKPFTVRGILLERKEHAWDRLTQLYRLTWRSVIATIYDLTHRANPIKVDVGEVVRIPLDLHKYETAEWFVVLKIHSGRRFRAAIPLPPTRVDEIEHFFRALFALRFPTLRCDREGERLVLYTYAYKGSPVLPQRQEIGDLLIGNILKGNRVASNFVFRSGRKALYKKVAEGIPEFMELRTEGTHLVAYWHADVMSLANRWALLGGWYESFQVPRKPIE